MLGKSSLPAIWWAAPLYNTNLFLPLSVYLLVKDVFMNQEKKKQPKDLPELYSPFEILQVVLACVLLGSLVLHVLIYIAAGRSALKFLRKFYDTVLDVEEVKMSL